MIARSRFPSLEPEAALAKVKDLTMRGPFSASEAKDAGLITDVKYKRQVVNSVMAYDDPQTISIPLPAPLSSGSTTPPPVATLQIPAHLDKENYEPPFHWFGFYHYHRVTERKFEKAKAPQAEVGVVYLLGTIGNDGSEYVCFT